MDALKELDDSRLWTMKDLEVFTQIPKRTLELHVWNGNIPSLKIGKHRRFDPIEIKKWVKRMCA